MEEGEGDEALKVERFVACQAKGPAFESRYADVAGRRFSFFLSSQRTPTEGCLFALG